MEVSVKREETSRGQSINRAMITHRKVKSKSQGALETFQIRDVITWHTSRTAKISLSLKCRQNECGYLCTIRHVQRGRQEEYGAGQETFRV